MTEGVLIALIVSGTSLIGTGINGYFMIKKNRKKPELGDNPHPCQRHEDDIKELKREMGEVKEDIGWIRGKLNNR